MTRDHKAHHLTHRDLAQPGPFSGYAPSNLPRRRIGLSATFFVLLFMAWHDHALADNTSTRSRVWGIDRFPIYTHAGYERLFNKSLTDSGYPVSQWNLSSETLIQAHLYRLEFGLGAAFRLMGFNYPRESPSNLQARTSRFSVVPTNAWLRIPFGDNVLETAIQGGIMPLQGHPNAILFGNYVARMHPHFDAERHYRPDLDSLGSLAPSVTGVTLSIGNQSTPIRAETWVVRDEEDFSILGFIHGSAPLGLEWGLGLCAYRVLPPRDPVIDYRWESNEDTVPEIIHWTHRDFLFSASASLDLGSLLDNDETKGRYGSLFAEAAVLGWKYNPYIDMSHWDRLIWTLGAHVPTFDWLDAFVLQIEKRPEWNHPSEWVRPRGVPKPSPWGVGAMLAKNWGSWLTFQLRVKTGEGFIHELGYYGLDFGNQEENASYSLSSMKCLARIVLRFP